MRKHGWQLPYHPLQVVAVAVFLALGFAFYVFFAPFLGKQLFQYIIMGIYTPLLICSFGLYIWCAAADPADPGVFKSKKHRKSLSNKDSKRAGEVNSSVQESCAATNEGEANCKRKMDIESGADRNTAATKKNPESEKSTCYPAMVAFLPCAYFSNAHEEPSDQMTEDGMFYCSLCEVEVFKYSKHCRVCDKCVDRFDHHCRWLNNCIGKRNYRKFFTLMVSAILLLILQWSTGILVLILCFLEKKRFATDISAKLGSSFTVVPFVIVVGVCTVLAMIATLPLAQLFFFHILLIKKGISTYDYIIALREQEQQGAGGQQSPQMSPVSNLTGLSSASSFQTFHRAAWCTPPRLFVEDQFDVVRPPDYGSASSLGRKTMSEEQTKKKNPAAVKISPWTLARLNAEDVSKAAAEARKKSKILRPVGRRESTYPLETDSSIDSSSGRLGLRPDNNRKRGNSSSNSKRIRLPVDVPFEQRPKFPAINPPNSNAVFAPLQSETGSAFRVSQANVLSGTIASSPESSLDSPDINPFRASSSGPEESRRFSGLSAAAVASQMDNPLSRSTSDGYDASGGEDSDRVPTRFLNKSNWSTLLFGSEPERSITNFGQGSSSSLSNLTKQ